ncbi:DUF5946 family protein [Pseudonocardia sp. NPDC049635]|uniref:DUF5946 family protein n=1 Tax=Pseudonocardia sp. NPDC049635 TaxID=3155506 RepID=UPI0033F5EDB4
MTAGCAGCSASTGPYLPSPECSSAALVLAEREFSDQEYFAVHRLTVAAYTLQHPDSVSEHSLAVHLGALYGAVVLGLDVAANGRRIRRLSAGLSRTPGPPLVRPAHRGELTVTDVVAAGSAAEHCAAVRRWATAVLTPWRVENDLAVINRAV